MSRLRDDCLPPNSLPDLGAPCGTTGIALARPGSESSSRVPPIAGHRLHFDSGGSEELADLGGMFKDVQRHAADNHSVEHAVVSMGGREWPSGHVLGERIEYCAHPPRQ